MRKILSLIFLFCATLCSSQTFISNHQHISISVEKKGFFSYDESKSISFEFNSDSVYVRVGKDVLQSFPLDFIYSDPEGYYDKFHTLMPSRQGYQQCTLLLFYKEDLSIDRICLVSDEYRTIYRN